MKDKQIIIDPCYKCDVEPPALKFKCPTCECNKENKQIIIDGVDVAECEYFKINKGFNCYKEHNCTDKECRDCYYKNWKRKEQEVDVLKKDNEELKKKCKKYGEINEQETKYYAELKAENEELKTGLKQIQKQFGIELLYCKATGKSTFRSTEILKLKQILTEIKKIAKIREDDINDWLAKEILQKINKI